MITYRLEIKIYVDDMIGTIAIELYSLVLADEFTLVPENVPTIAPGIADVKL
jgi:hypothetical protein